MFSVASIALLSGLTALPTEIPFKIGDNAIVVDAVINGRDGSFMFDTGFSGTLLMNDEINIGKASGQMNLRDFVGQFTAQTVPVKSLKLGGLTVDPKDREVVQQPLQHLTDSYLTHTDGIMGLEVFRDYVTEINIQHKKFIVHPKDVDISKRVPDNQRTFLLKMLPIGTNSIELTVDAPNGKMHLALDTGNAFYATTHKEVLERVGIWPTGQKPQFMRTSWVGSGPVNSFYIAMPEVKIFGVPVKQSVWSIIDLPSSSSEHDGTVGFGFLRNFNITFDLARRRVWLERWTDSVDSIPKADVGISAIYNPATRRVQIWNVTPASPAEKAGIKRGDDLLAIDGQELLSRSTNQLSTMLEGPENSAVKVAVSRNGNLTNYELKRQILVNIVKK